jgi:hypothetical protein
VHSLACATTTATFADDTGILASDSDPAIASRKLQTHLNAIANINAKFIRPIIHIEALL